MFKRMRRVAAGAFYSLFNMFKAATASGATINI